MFRLSPAHMLREAEQLRRVRGCLAEGGYEISSLQLDVDVGVRVKDNAKRLKGRRNTHSGEGQTVGRDPTPVNL